MRILQTTAKKQADALAGTTSNQVFAANCLPGSKVLAVFNHYNNSVANQRITAVNLGGTAATRDATKGDTATFNWADIWAATNVAGNSTNLNLTLGGAGHYFTGAGIELRGVYEFDQAGTGGQTNNSAPTPTAAGATAQADELVVAGFTDIVGTSWTSSAPPAGYTEIYEEPLGTVHQAGSFAHGKLSAIGTPAPAFATGAAMTWIAALATYKIYPYNHSYNLHFVSAGGSTLTTPAMSFPTTTGGTMMAFVGRGIAADFAGSTVSDNQGNGNYSMVGTSHTYTLWPSSGTAMYAKTSFTGGSGHTVTASKPSVNDEVTLLAVEVPGTVIQASAWNEDTTGPTNVSSSVTTTGPAWLVCFWSGDDGGGEANPAVDEASGWRKVEWTTSVASNHVQCAAAVRFVSGAGTYSCTWTPSTSQGAQMHIAAIQAAGAAATLSSATPSGTLGTSTTATAGATSDQSTGTFYSVLSTTNNVSTATAAQIKAGQNSTGASAAFASNSAVSTTSPSTGFTGLTAATTYFYASVQNNTNGDSNVVSGSFTTAAASTSSNQRLTLLGAG